MATGPTIKVKTNRQDLREYVTPEGDLVIAKRISPSEWRITAHSADLTAEVTGLAYRNDAGFSGREWESTVDGQQHRSLAVLMVEALAIAIHKSAFMAKTRALGIDFTVPRETLVADLGKDV